MHLINAYLSDPKIKEILRRNRTEKGFSLIELVVVIAVLAVLTAIALPNFLGVSEDASARTAQQGLLNAFKECKVKWARNKRSTTEEFSIPAITDWAIISGAATATAAPSTWTDLVAYGTAQPKTGDAKVKCFDAAGASLDIYAYPTSAKYPIYKVDQAGVKWCRVGDVANGKETYNIGCDSTTNYAVVEGWE